MAQSKIYTKFNPNTDIVVSQRVYTEGIFPGYLGTMSGSILYTSSIQQSGSSNTKNYFLTVTDSGSGGNEIFDIVYADNNSLAPDEQKAMYSQLANLLLSDPTANFTFGSGDTETNSIFAISFKRSMFKESLDAENWEIQFVSGALNRIYTDNSGATGATVSNVGKVYSVVSGSVANGAYDTTEVGNVYVDLGIIVFEGTAFTGSYNNITDESDETTYHSAFFNNIDHITARSSEDLKESNFFVRLMNRDYNYTNNPTFLTGSEGEIKFSAFKNDPKVYPTTVGLYNDQNELIATARLSSPVQKSFSKEAVITCKLSY